MGWKSLYHQTQWYEIVVICLKKSFNFKLVFTQCILFSPSMLADSLVIKQQAIMMSWWNAKTDTIFGWPKSLNPTLHQRMMQNEMEAVASWLVSHFWQRLRGLDMQNLRWEEYRYNKTDGWVRTIRGGERSFSGFAVALLPDRDSWREILLQVTSKFI